MINPKLIFITLGGHKLSLETVRIRFGWPKDGFWDYDLARDAWRYHYSTGPKTFAITVGKGNA